MATMHGPHTGDLVTLVVPQREQTQARVYDTGSTWVDLQLTASPRTSWPQLSRCQVFVQFAGAQGLCRMVGQVSHRPEDAGLRVVGYGAGEIIRFTHRGHIQLLRRPALVAAAVSARVIMLRCGSPDHVAVEARCVAISGGSLKFRGLPSAQVGQLYQFDLYLIGGEAPISGQVRIERVDREGVVEGRLTIIAASERSRLVHFAAEHARARVA